MTYESLLDKVRKDNKIHCPGCGSDNMKFMSHLSMYGGYVCSGCSTIWPDSDPKIKEQKRRTI
ncbi:MAG: hypothetical protein ABIG84_06845 [archaeon]